VRVVELSSNPSDLRLRARARDLFVSRLNHTVVDQALQQGGVRLWVAATVNHVNAVRTIGARYTPRAYIQHN
jgi:post-segregation antitoxin (ccd killing protein)